MTSNDIFLGGGSSSGNYNRANLPNIKGRFSAKFTQYEANPDNILFVSSLSYSVTNSQGIGGNGADIYIDVNKYNSTYNDSNRVNPNYYTIEFWIKFK